MKIIKTVKNSTLIGLVLFSLTASSQVNQSNSDTLTIATDTIATKNENKFKSFINRVIAHRAATIDSLKHHNLPPAPFLLSVGPFKNLPKPQCLSHLKSKLALQKRKEFGLMFTQQGPANLLDDLLSFHN